MLGTIIPLQVRDLIFRAEWLIKQDMHPIKAHILNVIETMPLSMISLQEVARRIQRSERHLSRLFQAKFKMYFHQYIQEYHLHEAIKLLQETSLTIKEIMKKIGYSDADHFNGLFKRKTGLTPR
jgi:AraC-like DNA-binding protein